MSEKLRTIHQNKALHKMLSELANTLNEYGINYEQLIISADIPWSPEMTKDLIWRPVMKAYCGKKSTTEMTTTDIDKIFEIIVKAVGEKTGAVLQWPSISTLINEQRLKE